VIYTSGSTGKPKRGGDRNCRALGPKPLPEHRKEPPRGARGPTTGLPQSQGTPPRRFQTSPQKPQHGHERLQISRKHVPAGPSTRSPPTVEGSLIHNPGMVAEWAEGH
jgi:hypothetical protein